MVLKYKASATLQAVRRSEFQVRLSAFSVTYVAYNLTHTQKRSDRDDERRPRVVWPTPKPLYIVLPTYQPV